MDAAPTAPEASPGAPQRSDARRNRDKLLAAALDHFERHASEASLEAIARQAGVGIGTLYRHFPTRDALILAAHERWVAQLSEAAPELLAEMEPVPALRTWMERLATLGIQRRWMADAISAAAEARGGAPSPAYLMLLEALGRLLDDGRAAGAIRGDICAADVLLAISGFWHVNLAEDWQAQVQRLLDLLMDGLQTLRA
ncbi:TetR/AcrR family transcriptional regulator [Baekduia soli]|uniref:TetR/AcrR family transcriptional regulator n=1 Tax=Baekduia soli TaxID=496014 RepID=UPI001652A6DE|nr:TetR/AcrR family transcriptional regulator [Baekduia soli]